MIYNLVILCCIFDDLYSIIHVVMAGSSAPVFKSFVSEKEIEDVKKKRQDEWERVRKPEDPIGTY